MRLCCWKQRENDDADEPLKSTSYKDFKHEFRSSSTAPFIPHIPPDHGTYPLPKWPEEDHNDHQDRDTPGEQREASPEDLEIASVKQEIRETSQQTLNSTQRALLKAEEAENTGRHTLDRLGEQRNKILNTEQSMIIAKAESEEAKSQTHELKDLHDKPFFVYVPEPKQKRGAEEKAARREEQMIEEIEKRKREALEHARQTDAVLGKPGSTRSLNHSATGSRKANDAEQGHEYTFEANSDDIKRETEIDKNVDELGDVVRRLKSLAVATHVEIVSQNDRLGEIKKLVCISLHDLLMNRARKHIRTFFKARIPLPQLIKREFALFQIVEETDVAG